MKCLTVVYDLLLMVSQRCHVLAITGEGLVDRTIHPDSRSKALARQ